MKRILLLSVVVLLFIAANSQPPTISSFSPATGPVGTAVTITGTNFSSNPADNIVYFGAVKAPVTIATSSSLVVTVPAGTTYQPITVTSQGLTAYSRQPFIATFNGTGFSAGSFGEKVTYPAENFPFAIAVVDFDGDGKPDVAVSHTSSNNLSIYKNTSSNNTVILAPALNIATMRSADIAIGDLDGDGKMDIAVTHNSNSILILRNTSSPGNISFTEKEIFPVGHNPLRLAIGDFNADGKPDIAVANRGIDCKACTYPGSVSILKNVSSKGAISFAEKIDFFVGGHWSRLAVGDLNEDGKVDLVIGNEGGGLNFVKNITTGGAISFAPRISVPFNYPDRISLGDLDRDGKIDLAAENSVDGIVSIFKNDGVNGELLFNKSFDLNVPTTSRALALSDLDGDGKVDLAVGRDNNISLLKNSGNVGTIKFNAPVSVSITGGGVAYNFAIADINGDGKPDIAFTDPGSNTISILKNLIPPSPSCTPPTFLNNNQIVLDATCGKNDGNISIIPTSGTEPFMYSINGGSTYVSGPNAGYTFNNLGTGTYQLKLKDANNCESAVVERRVRTTGGPTFLNNSQIVLDATCGKNDGNISIIPTSGNAPFVYSIDEGVTYVSGPNGGYTFNNLAPGTYKLRLADARGCESAIVEKAVNQNKDCPLMTIVPSPGYATGIAEMPVHKAEVVLTYPNPSKGQFRLQLQNFISTKAEVSIFDGKGTLVEKRWVNAGEGSSTNFNLGGRSNGMYYIKIVSSQGIRSAKILIQ